MSQASKIHTFTEQGESNLLIDTDGEFYITSLAVVGRYAYVTTVVPSGLRRVDMYTGEAEPVADLPSDPWDIEFIPATLAAP